MVHGVDASHIDTDTHIFRTSALAIFKGHIIRRKKMINYSLYLQEESCVLCPKWDPTCYAYFITVPVV